MESPQQHWRSLLTKREQEIMLLVAGRLGNQAIARKLRLGEGTVRFQVHNILRKLSVKNRADLAELLSRD